MDRICFLEHHVVVILIISYCFRLPTISWQV
jgi:hypothetical protein